MAQEIKGIIMSDKTEPKVMEKIPLLGANWKPRVTALFTALVAYIYAYPQVLEPIPEPVKGYIWHICNYLIFAGIIGIGFVVKGSKVTGGSVQQPEPPVRRIIEK